MKISEGCDRPCSFCAIPLMRGKHSSVPAEQLVDQAKKLAANGVKELLLIAQDSTYYGLDLYNERRLAELLNRLADVKGIEWLRLHYAFPSGFPLEILDVIRDRKNICKYIDIPLQHISDKILSSMRRGLTSAKTKNLMDEIRNRVPGIAIRTTFISGYPGETDDDHNQLIRFIEEMQFERMGVFIYSHEENTRAYYLNDDVPADVKKERSDELMTVQQKISRLKNEKLVGRKLKVLFDRKEGEYFIGRTEFDSPEVDNEVLVDAKTNYVRVGDFAEIEITSCEEFDLFGNPVH
jgi:ribosomal protein S12 methylthiotransferase